MNEKNAVRGIYDWLFSQYGPQGWWPIEGIGYHRGDYSFPRDGGERFEICAGAILAQNTSWKNAQKAVANLKNANSLDAKKIAGMDLEKLQKLVRPSGYYKAKARKLKGFTEFFMGLEGRVPEREELLSVWGVGPETADSILLYAYKVPSFVVDAYTRRVFANLGLVGKNAGYGEVKAFCERNLEKDAAIYQEYHALIVEHAKRHYAKKADWGECPLKMKFGRRTV